MFGGADALIANMIAADIEFVRNSCVKPSRWNPFDQANFQPLAGQQVTWTTSPKPGPAEDQSQAFAPRYVDAQGNTAKHWTVKNLFELKNALRVLIEGCVLDGTWADAQAFAVQFTPRNQDGTNPWAIVADVLMRNSIVRNCPSGINLLGKDYNYPSQRAARIAIANNLLLCT